MSESQPRIQIHILAPEDEADADLTDLGLVDVGGERYLFLRPQSFDSAVRQVCSAMPDMPVEQVERLVRERPEFKNFDELLGTVDSPPPLDITPKPGKPFRPARSRGRVKGWVVAAALAPALVGSWALGRYTSVVGNESVQAKVSAPHETKTEDAPFADEKFDFFAGASKIECDPVSTLEAECTDVDGMVMSSKAATGPDSTIFTFSYGSERIGLRIFYNTGYAHTWTRQDGSRELYPHMQVHGRYVLWGTDPQRIHAYLRLLKKADRAAGPSAMGRVTPLPPRLAALTLGTLGLDQQQVSQIIARPALAVTDAPAMVAARLVLGLDTAPADDGRDSDDIVAIALGIQSPPVTGGVILTANPVKPAPAVPAAPAPTPRTPTAPATPTAPPPPIIPSVPSVPSTPTTPASPSTPAPPPVTMPPPTDTTPAPPSDPAPTPSQPEETGTPSAPPVEEAPQPPAEDTSDPAETPALETTPHGQNHSSETAQTSGQEESVPSGTDD
ncbi:hypothetical protein [Streptomyces sp. NPDC046976]|uniref:hypothetical protein n=1 Tax=Streptomyces sp. NPDC046976 TaxID=3155258 RepID=UPI00340D7FF6